MRTTFLWMMMMGLMSMPALHAQRNWYRQWQKSWPVFLACNTQPDWLNCLRSSFTSEHFMVKRLSRTIGKTLSAGSFFQIQHRSCTMGTEFLPLPFSGNGHFEADVLPDIQELNKPWLVSLSSLYASDTMRNLLQAMYASASQAQQNGAQAWIGYGHLPLSWQSINDSLHFPSLQIPAIWVSEKIIGQNPNLHVAGQIEMTDSLVYDTVGYLSIKGRQPFSLWIICADSDREASFFQLISYNLFQKVRAPQRGCHWLWIPTDFSNKSWLTLVQQLSGENSAPPVGILYIRTISADAKPFVETVYQSVFWQSFFSGLSTKHWQIRSPSADSLFQGIPTKIPFACVGIPAIRPNDPNRQAVDIRGEVYRCLASYLQKGSLE
ncbi:MAG: hypothetical protein K6T34_07110 [Thermoflavifilum sp.]|nr:hypothetical protein [Thermoflavifilum sp.]